MGQYYRIINVNKEEYLSPWTFDCGSKLMEWSYNGNEITNTMTALLATRWKGDRVYVVGDYADGQMYADTDSNWTPKYKEIVRTLNTEENLKKLQDAGISFWDDTVKESVPLTSNNFKKVPLYSLAGELFRELTKEDLSDIQDVISEAEEYKYLYNDGLGQYIDLNKCPLEEVYAYRDKNGDIKACEYVISPLSLLLAMGNGRGGGDFKSSHGAQHIAAWVKTSDYINVQKEKLKSHDTYKEFNPDFSERDQIIPYIDKEKAFSEALDLFKKKEESINAYQEQSM